MPVPQGFTITNPTYKPVRREITNITNALQGEVTTSQNHEYETGDIVRIIIPIGWGITALNDKVATITVTGDTTFTLDINTSAFDSFVTPPDPSPEVESVAQVIPIGEVASKLTQATRNVL